jgi:hypothetical protein
MERNRCGATVRMAKLLIGTALTHFVEAEAFKYADNFPGLQYREVRRHATWIV